MRRVAIYARADDVPDARERLDIQIATVAAFVRRRGDWHVATYADVGPRAPLERPGLARLLTDARCGDHDVVVVEHRETITPDPAGRRRVRDWLGVAGVSVIVMRPPARARLGRAVAALALVDLADDR